MTSTVAHQYRRSPAWTTFEYVLTLNDAHTDCRINLMMRVSNRKEHERFAGVTACLHSMRIFTMDSDRTHRHNWLIYSIDMHQTLSGKKNDDMLPFVHMERKLAPGAHFDEVTTDACSVGLHDSHAMLTFNPREHPSHIVVHRNPLSCEKIGEVLLADPSPHIRYHAFSSIYKPTLR